MGPWLCTYLIYGLERQPERTLPEPRLREVRLPQQVRVAEHELDGRAGAVRGVRVGRAEDAAGADRVERELDVERPVARVVEDEDGSEAC